MTLWDASRYAKLTHLVDSDNNDVADARMNASGARLITGSDDGRARLWRLEPG